MSVRESTETGTTIEAQLSPEQISKIAEGGDFAAFEAARSGRKPAAHRVGAKPNGEGEDHTGDPPETGVTGASPETEEESDGDLDAGGKAGDRTTDDLPKGIKRRLDRAKRGRDAARHEAETWRKRAEAAEAKLAGGEQQDTADSGGDPETQTQSAQNAVSDEPLSDEEYSYDYPEEADYVKGEDDAEGLTAFLEDVERWEQNIPLKGGKHAPASGGGDEGGGGEAKPNGEQSQSQQSQSEQGDTTTGDELTPDQAVRQMFADIRETLEESDTDYDGDLSQDFFDQFQSGKFQISYQMLEWLANNDDDAVKVLQEFTTSPRKANRIYRQPSSKHAQLLSELAKGGESGKRRTPTTANRDGKTVVDELNGRRPADPQKALSQAKDFGEYETLRKGMDAR